MSSNATTPGVVSARAPAVVDVAVAGALVIVAATLVAAWAGLGLVFVAKAACAAVAGGIVGARLCRDLPWVNRFSAADRVTLARTGLVMLIIAAIGETPTTALMTLTLILAAVAAILDAVDGEMARRTGQATAFGARFDMEADALLVFALSVLACTWDKAGAWILLAGLARYLFVAAACIAPFMRQELPPSYRRRAVCAIQVVTLIACIAPWVTSPMSDLVAASGLIALIYSFAVDICWCFRSGSVQTPPGGSS